MTENEGAVPATDTLVVTRSRRSGLPRISPLLRQAGVYTVSNLASSAVPFLLLPVMTRYLTPADYGTVAMFMLLVALFEPFINVGLAGAVTVKFFDKSIDLPAYLGSGLALVAAVGVVVLGLLFVLRQPVSDVTQVPPEWLLLIVPLVFARTIGTSLLALFRVREQALLYSLFDNVQSAALILLALVLVVGFGFDWRGRIAAEVIVWLAFAAVSFAWLRRTGWIRLTIVREYAGNIARFGMPLIPHTLGAVIMTQTDRLLLTNLVGVSETGLYVVAYQLTLVIELFAVSFNYAYAPWLFRQLANIEPGTKRRLVRFTYLQFGAMTILATGVAVFMPIVMGVLLGHGFAGAETFIPWFALGFLFSGMYYMVTNYIFYVQKTAFLATVTITVALINIPLTYLLIKANGGIGAAQALAISYGLSFVFTWLVSQRVYPLPWLRGLMSPDGGQA